MSETCQTCHSLYPPAVVESGECIWCIAEQFKRDASAMREAIKDSDAALRKCLNYMLRLPMSGSDAECEAMDDAHHALTKLQPFLAK